MEASKTSASLTVKLRLIKHWQHTSRKNSERFYRNMLIFIKIKLLGFPSFSVNNHSHVECGRFDNKQ